MVSCTGLQERALGDGRLEVVANLKNSGEKPVKVLIQCVFLDEEGLPIGGGGPVADPGDRGRTRPRSCASRPRSAAARKYSIRVRKAHADHFFGGGSRENETVPSTPRPFPATAASIAALSAALSLPRPAKPSEKSIVFPSWIGTRGRARHGPARLRQPRRIQSAAADRGRADEERT
jgi:hypothetical protein